MKPSSEAASNLIESLMTDTVIPNAELRKAASDLLGALKADGYPDQSVLAELQQLADGHPMPKKVTNEE